MFATFKHVIFSPKYLLGCVGGLSCSTWALH